MPTPTGIPEWAADDLSKIASEIAEMGISEESLNLLREKLSAAGLGEYFSQALHTVIGAVK